jgi:hypothetical protein
MASSAIPQSFYRGQTVQVAVTFYDVNGVIIQPSGAVLNVTYQDPTDEIPEVIALTMAPPGGGSVAWTVQIDTRNMGQGPIYWSAHSAPAPGDMPPVAVLDGFFLLTANNANLVTF